MGIEAEWLGNVSDERVRGVEGGKLGSTWCSLSPQ